MTASQSSESLFAAIVSSAFSTYICHASFTVPGVAAITSSTCEGNTITPRTFSMSSERPMMRPTSGRPLRPHGQS